MGRPRASRAAPARAAAAPVRPVGGLGQWRIPQRVLDAAAPLDPELWRRAQDALRAHSVLLTDEGGLHPILLHGYLDDPQLPLRYAATALGGQLRAARAAQGQNPQVAMYTVRARDAEWFNPFASLVGAHLGLELAPLYGKVFVCRAPHPQTGVITKLPVAVKELIAMYKTWILHSLAGQVPRDMPPAAHTLMWERLSQLFRMHRGEDPAPQPGDPA